MSESEIRYFHLGVGARLTLSFQRTLRIPDDGKDYPLPPGLGAFPVYRAINYPQTPEGWQRNDELFISMHQREAMWIGMQGAPWKPSAVQAGMGETNAVSGLDWEPQLIASPQNYLVCPPQPWLDGINVGPSRIRQFVAMPLGAGYTIEEQTTERQATGGLRLAVYDPKPGRFPDEPPKIEATPQKLAMGMPMGVAAGGTMRQKIYPDPYGADTWNPEPLAQLRIHIVDSAAFHDLTGLDAPASPISAAQYTEYGLPWFELYDEDRESVGPPDQLAAVKSIDTIDRERQRPHEELASLNISQNQTWKLF